MGGMKHGDEAMSTLRRMKWVTATLVTAILAPWSCDGPVDPESAAGLLLEIPSLTANYNNGVIDLTWEAPEGSFDYYRVYRTTETDPLGNPDMSKLVSTLQRDSIAKTRLSFVDQPEPAEGTYYYGIRAVRIADDGTHEEGALSPLDAQGNTQLVAVEVGYDVRFTINRDDEYTLTPSCSLIVEDPDHVLSSVRFTQIRGDSVATGAGEPVDEKDLYNQVRDMNAYGLLLPPGVSYSVPDTGRINFEVDDPWNPNRTPHYDASRGVHGLAWQLKPGSGRKSVYAELTYNTGTKDTVTDIIYTQPHNVALTIRNSSDIETGTVRDTSESYLNAQGQESEVQMLVFYTDTIRFSVKVFGDRAIERDFEYWLVSAKAWSDAAPNSLQKKPWIMTTPQSASLTDTGGLHDPGAVYSIDVDTVSARGKTLFDTLLAGKRNDVDTLFTGPYREQKEWFDKLFSSGLYEGDNRARKQFLLVARFKESYFGGSFLLVYGLNGPDVEETRTYRDIYPPLVKYDNGEENEHRLAEGDTVNGPFTFALDTASLIDSGLARITDVRLGIARLPSGYEWSPDSAGDFTLDDFYSLSNEVFAFSVEKPAAVIKDVRWEDIDPTEWTSGHYLVGIIYANARGDEGFAWVWGDTKYVGTNPFRVYVSTSN